MPSRAFVLAAVLPLGCGAGTFACDQDTQCVDGDIQGVCVGPGSCAFPDEGCDSGLRFGEHGASSAGECVPLDAASSTGVPPTSSNDATTAGPSVGTTTDPGVGSSSGPAAEGSTGPVGPDPDLVVWYRFDPNVGLFADAGPNGLPATCVDPTCPVEGADRGIQFDGTDDVLVVDAVPQLDVPAPFSVTVWAQLDEPSSTGFRLVAARPVGTGNLDSWQIGVNDGASWYFGVGNSVGGDVLQQAVGAGGAWTFLALVYDGTEMRALVGGIAVGQIAVPPVAYDDHPMLIGGDEDMGMLDNRWDGRIDDFRIYARALSDLELLDVMAER